MGLFQVLLCCLSVLLVSCSDSTGPGNTNDGGDGSGTTISIDGGRVDADNISISVPAGAFSNTTSVSVAATAENPFEGDAVSETYTVSGLPQSFDKDLTIDITYSGELTDNSYIAVGTNTWVSSYGGMTATYAMLPATVSDGTISAMLPKTAGGVAKTTGTHDDEAVTLTFTAVTGYKPYVTPEGHFEIDYASRWTTPASVEELGRYLEDAYNTIPTLGFSYAKRTIWPVSVTVRDLGTLDGASSSSIWGDNYGYLEFNRNIMDNPLEMRTTAGHEFFHLVQALYDPRNAFSKAKLEAPQLWLDEACSVWIEGKFSGQEDYVSAARTGNLSAPFDGVVSGAGSHAGEHGYGLSAMIKYLVDEYGESCIISMYEALKSGSDPMTSVIQATELPVVWWGDFLRKYAIGDIYGLNVSNVVSFRSDMFQIKSSQDSLETFTDAYADLSAKIYVIRLDDPEISEDAMLSLSLESDMGEMSVYTYCQKPAKIEFLGSSIEQVTVPDLKALTDDELHVIVMVSNSRSIDPYTSTTDITLTARVKGPDEPQFNYVTIQPKLIGDFEYSYHDGDTSVFSPSTTLAGPGTLDGTTFAGERNDHYISTTTGNYRIEFNESFTKILYLEASQHTTKPGTDGAGDSYQTVTLIAHDIPLDINHVPSGTYTFRLEGDEVADLISSMTYEFGVVDHHWVKLVDYRSDSSCSIVISLTKL